MTRQQRVLVTGANGFVGSRLCRILHDAGFDVRGAVRREESATGVSGVVVGDIGPNTDWRAALDGVDAVVHLAALGDLPAASDEMHHYVNFEGSRCLARQAHEAGIRRLIYISTIKVNGEITAEQPFTAGDEPQPRTAYARFKRDAEEALLALGRATPMEVVIVRPPLVYGPGASGNFAALAAAVGRGLPLPFASLDNRRSFVSVFNLCHFIRTCLVHPGAVGGTFLVSDNEDLSTPELVHRIAAATGCRARLLPCPATLLKWLFAVSGRRGLFDKLCVNLQLDVSESCRRLGWTPPFPVDQSLRMTLGDLP